MEDIFAAISQVDPEHIQPLPPAESEALIERAQSSDSVSRVRRFFDEDENPLSDATAIDGVDDVRVVSFSGSRDADGGPDAAITIAFEGDEIVNVTGERRHPAGTVEYVYPEKLAPEPADAREAITASLPAESNPDVAVSEESGLIVFRVTFDGMS